MKVSELKVGMMLVPSDKDASFYISKFLPSDPGEIKWANVVKRHRPRGSSYGSSWMRNANNIRGTAESNFAVYVGTKKDIGREDFQWCDRFALINGQIVAIDPAAWRRIKAFNDDECG